MRPSSLRFSFARSNGDSPAAAGAINGFCTAANAGIAADDGAASGREEEEEEGAASGNEAVGAGATDNGATGGKEAADDGAEEIGAASGTKEGARLEADCIDDDDDEALCIDCLSLLGAGGKAPPRPAPARGLAGLPSGLLTESARVSLTGDSSAKIRRKRRKRM